MNYFIIIKMHLQCGLLTTNNPNTETCLIEISYSIGEIALRTESDELNVMVQALLLSTKWKPEFNKLNLGSRSHLAPPSNDVEKDCLKHEHCGDDCEPVGKSAIRLAEFISGNGNAD